MRDFHAEITNQIIEDMEKGVLPWEKSWKGSGVAAGLPMNAATGKGYRGFNILALWAASAKLGTDDMRFLTFKQALDCGGAVRKGEKGHKIYFYKQFEVDGEEAGDKPRSFPMLREYTVFHVTQVDGCSDLKGAAAAVARDIPEDAQEFVTALGARLIHGGDRACYSSSHDRLMMPWADDFRSLNDYRATLYHELTHWTGHASRLARPLGNAFGSKAYAAEELIAEMGGAFLCAEFGLPYQTQHAAYLQNWLGVLKEDKRAIMKAASAAQKAVDFLRAAVLGAGSQPQLPLAA